MWRKKKAGARAGEVGCEESDDVWQLATLGAQLDGALFGRECEFCGLEEEGSAFAFAFL